MSRDSKLRVSQHSGREGSARHNDRSFLDGRSQAWVQEHADHIDTTKTHENLIWTWDGSRDIQTSERAWYAQAYGAAQEATNSRYRREGHADRCKTTDDLYDGKLTRPEEMILQIGTMHDDIDPKAFTEAVEDYMTQLDEACEGHSHILSIAVHFDEASPHAHVRRVWDYQDRDGLTRLGQDKALEAMGVPLPDPDKPKSRYNHRKLSFDKRAREVWQQICISHGFEIETEPRPDRKHKAKADYIRDQLSQEIDQAQQKAAQAEQARQQSERQAQEAAQRAQEAAYRADKASVQAMDATEALRRSEGLLAASQGKLQATETRLRDATTKAEQAQATADQAKAQVQQLQRDAQEARDSLTGLDFYREVERAPENDLLRDARQQVKRVPLKSGWSMLPTRALDDIIRLSDTLWRYSRVALQAHQDKVLAESKAEQAWDAAEAQYSREYHAKQLSLMTQYRTQSQQLARYQRLEQAFPQVFDQMTDRLREVERQQARDHDRGQER